MNYRLKGFGDLDPGQVLTDAVNQAQQRTGSAGLFMLAILAGVGFLVLQSGKRGY